MLNKQLVSTIGTVNCRTPKALPSADHLRECLIYQPDTGSLVWRERPISHFVGAASHRNWNRRFAGVLVKHSTSRMGYRRILIDGEIYPQHRIIWKLVHGVEPIYIDHINGIPGDNRLSNLRNVPHVENMRNRRISKANKSGVAGVLWYPDRKRWAARIGLNGTHKHLGFYGSADEAVAARRAAERDLGFLKISGEGA